jgi:hypothetical protein
LIIFALWSLGLEAAGGAALGSEEAARGVCIVFGRCLILGLAEALGAAAVAGGFAEVGGVGVVEGERGGLGGAGAAEAAEIYRLISTDERGSAGAQAIPGDAAGGDVEEQDDEGGGEEALPDGGDGVAGRDAVAVEEVGAGELVEGDEAAAGGLGELCEEGFVGSKCTELLAGVGGGADDGWGEAAAVVCGLEDGDVGAVARGGDGTFVLTWGDLLEEQFAAGAVGGEDADGDGEEAAGGWVWCWG